ncbi:helix-turn-helix domain-containing protein [Olivibacter sp. XZL3]|uniref:helix-turn-helix domain-containing protein n=1 Tax=Olivibacter sp. XZL3 TaxID=1735116 RepID=UPI0010658C46|nr:helix-turn-helix domain-containing protein [Olivibacter sp. XZL3]
MSSNIVIKRICEYCGKEFDARTTVTRFCSHTCNRRAYKAIKRGEKVQVIKKEVEAVKKKPYDDIAVKPVLNVNEVAVFLGTTKQTVNKMIRSGRLDAENFGVRLTRIRKEDLDSLFSQPEVIISPWELQQEKEAAKPLKRNECYTIMEVLLRYNVSPAVLTRMIREHNIRKEQDGQNIIVPKAEIDRLFDGFQTKESEQKENEDLLPLDPGDCYTIAEAEKILNMASSGVYYGILNRGIRKERIGRFVYVPKGDIDQWALEQLPKYEREKKYTVEALAKLLGRSQSNVRQILDRHGVQKIVGKKGHIFLLKREVDPLIPLYKRC